MRVSAVAFLVVGSAAFNKHIGKEFARFAQRYATAGMSVLEVGGTDFNGTPRPMFESRGCKYTAMDIALGRGVDLVNVPGEPFPMADGSYDIVVTTSTFEHDPTFWMTMREIARVVRTGGIIFASAPSVGSYHAHPGDNWRFYRDAPAALAFWCGKELAMGGGPARSYPVEVIDQYFLDDMWKNNFMTWRRTTTPVLNFTMGPQFDTAGASLAGARASGGSKGRGGNRR